MQRFVCVAVALFVLVSSSLFAKGQQEGTADAAEEPIKITVVMHLIKDRVIKHTPAWAEAALVKFNLDMEIKQFPSPGVEKVNLLMAAKDYPDVCVPQTGALGGKADCDRWGMDGHLVPISDHWDRLPDYMTMWAPEDFEALIDWSQAPDGEIYFMPQSTISYHRSVIGWIYRKDVFDKHGLPFPKTPDELFNTLVKLKEIYPDCIPFANRGGIFYFLWGPTFAWRTNNGAHIDVDSGELVYGPATDKWREVLKFAAKLYANGMVDPEFATASRQQWEALHRQGICLIEHNYMSNYASYTNYARESDPDAQWWFNTDAISPYRDEKAIVDWRIPFGGPGPWVTRGSESKVNAILDFLNWCSTEEGIVSLSFGKEGETFEWVDDRPQWLPTMATGFNNWEGTPLHEYGLYINGITGAKRLYETYPESVMGAEESATFGQMLAAAEGRDSISHVNWQFTKTEDKDRADLGTVIADTRDQYALKFIMGQLHAADDAQWQAYLDELEKAGLSRYMEIYKTAYERKYQ